VDKETAVPWKRVQDAETASIEEHDDMRNAERVGSTTRKQEITFEEMLSAIGDRASDISKI